MLDGAIAAIEIKGTDQTRNNLVSWEGRYGLGSANHASLVSARTNPQRRRAFERWLWDAFRIGSQPDELFERLRELTGDGYPLAAYLFFLIDIDRFAPIAPRTFDEAFRRLGIDLRTSERLIAQERGYGGLPAQELVHGVPHAEFINASFAYAKPREPMRFSPADRGA